MDFPFFEFFLALMFRLYQAHVKMGKAWERGCKGSMEAKCLVVGDTIPGAHKHRKAASRSVQQLRTGMS